MIRRFLIAAAFACASVAAPDHPGERFQIHPNALAKPFATAAADNGGNMIARPAGVLPDGHLKSFATGMRNPVGIAFCPGTDDL